MDEAIRAQRNNIGVSKGFYTVSEAAKVLGVGQRRVLEMVETKELEGERDPTSSRWKISMQAVQELAAEESLDTKQPPREDPTERFSEQSEEHLWERINELEQLHKRLQVEQQTEKAAWQEER